MKKTKFKIALIIFISFTLLALTTSLQVQLSGVSKEFGIKYYQLLPLHLIDWYIWAFLTPLIFLIAKRYRFEKDFWVKALQVHIPASVLFSLFYIFISNIINALFEGESLFTERFNQNYLFILFSTFHKEVITYWLILITWNAFNYYKSYREKESIASQLEIEKTELENKLSEIRTNGMGRLEKILVKSGGNFLFIESDDIDWIEAADYYVQIHANGKKHLLRQSMIQLEEKLDKSKFFRIHRSTIVNIERIREMKHYRRGDYIIILNNDTKLKLTRSRRKELQKLIDIKL